MCLLSHEVLKNVYVSVCVSVSPLDTNRALHSHSIYESLIECVFIKLQTL